MQLSPSTDPLDTPRKLHSPLWEVLFLLALLVGAVFRITGMNWDASQHMHPDERFLTMVESSIAPVNSLAEYFDTQASSLNPNNRGYGFYVYGDLPLVMVRYVAEWVKQTGYDQVYMVGRYMSAFVDLLTALLVYLAALRLFRDSRIAALGGAFYSLAVLPIQLSHFWAVDTFVGFFGFLTFYFAVRVMTAPLPAGDESSAIPAVADPELADPEVTNTELPYPESPNDNPYRWLTHDWGSLAGYILFGVAVGMAAASKVSAGLMAFLLPVAAYVWWSRLPEDKLEREGYFMIILRNLVMAGIVAFLSFRIFQPYAFSGPGFFGFKPNPIWIANLKELAVQTTGDVDFPPALQWARRPIYFAWINMVKWGFGLPLGLLAWGGFLYMGWRILKGEWRKYILIWGWTGVYFAWWEINFTRTMRYQMLVYPTLAIIAGWALVAVWENGERLREGARALLRARWLKTAAVVLGAAVLVATAAWAFAFTRIYTRPMTRVAASQWIYNNIPAAINLKIDGATGSVSQPVAYHYGFELDTGMAWTMNFKPQANAALMSIDFAHIVDIQPTMIASTLIIDLKTDPNGNSLATATVSDPFISTDDARGKEYRASFPNPVPLKAGQPYYLVMTLQGQNAFGLSFSGAINLEMADPAGSLVQPLAEPVSALIDGRNSFTTAFNPIADGALNQVTLAKVVDWSGSTGDKTLAITISDQPPGGGNVLARGTLTGSFTGGKDGRGSSDIISLSPSAAVHKDTTYYLTIEKTPGPGEVAIYGSRTAIESSWDDPLPLPMEGYNPFDPTTGLYPTDLNFEMYWDDNTDKLNRFVSILDQTDYIFISSNRQWATTVRVPERYPLTAYYYRQLIGCPENQSIINCFATAQPGSYQGNLGFELVKTFQSNPTLGPLQFNDQFAEEAFTVYDHPKVLIFKKTANYDPNRVRAMLSSVDLSNAVHITPRKASSYVGNLMLPPMLWTIQQDGGTWSKLFNSLSLFNLQPGLALVLWYIVITLLGWMVYPFVRLALKPLPDHGYPMTKLVGMLLLAYFSWLAGSAQIPVTKTLITGVAVALLGVNVILAVLQRDSLREEWQERKRYFLMVEGIALAFFAVDLLIRLGNPDLWHPYKGGEKPMDFSYFNAIIKSTVYPPYDPWFAGGYINYYYFGFVIVGIPVKWLGIMPSIAYNLILPTMFSFLAMGAFSFAWNVFAAFRKQPEEEEAEPPGFWQRYQIPLLAGLAAAVGLLILGNEGTVRMIWHGLMRLAAPDGNDQVGNLITKIGWTVQGMGKIIHGAKLPYAPGDWYWIPSRVYPGSPITEFPFFTFLYGDPHAHLYALPLTVLALSWALSIVLGRWHWGSGQSHQSWLFFLGSFFLGGLVIGSLRPVNTWDLPTYLSLGVIAITYAVFHYRKTDGENWIGLQPWLFRLLVAVGSILLLVGLSFVLYAPYARWYATGYNSLELWKGDRSPFWSYTTHWGLFLFVIITWLVWETRDWMASTPVSSLKKLQPYLWLIYAVVVALVLAVAGLLVMKVQIAWLALPVAVWAAVLIFRPGQSDLKRFVLFMVGSGVTLTLMVELVRLTGDIDRMNTVFKFYLQAWTLLSLSAAAALVWLWPSVMDIWNGGWRNAWSIALTLLVFGAFLFPLFGGYDKITDRMAKNAPHTLDGMAYMPYATYSEHDIDMQLVQDYLAIGWMQENVQGSPVIVEANSLDLYRWFNRYTIYTGLPDVVGWDWHERQQRSVVPGEWVTNRVTEIADFYSTTDPFAAQAFLKKYNAKYVIVGQAEEALYPGPGLHKFQQYNNVLWKQVYHQDQTTIYEVIP